MSGDYDVIIVGAGGAMGSAAAFHLAARGLKVLGLEQFTIPNEKGSSHGRSRIIRSVYTEHPSYVPLVQRSFELWRDLEKRAGRQLLVMTGGLDIGPEDGKLIAGSRAACALHDLEHEVLSGHEVNRRHPAFSLPAHFAAVAYPDAGILRPEACIRAHCQLARDLGAVLRDSSAVTAIEPGDHNVTVRLDSGETFSAPQLVVSAGAWMPKLFPEFSPFLQPERQVVGWFPTDRPDLFTPDIFPVFILEPDQNEPGQDTKIGWYGFPSFDGDPMKFARYGHLKEKTDADTISRIISAADKAVFGQLQPYFAAALGEPKELKTCMFTYSPDHHFVMGFHPEHDNIFVLSTCSGHGLKFAELIGEITADMLTTGRTRHDIALHDIRRLKL